MKKYILTLVVLLQMAASAMGMSYEQARQQALFLADKMAYELNLNEEQYEACYEVNLDYFMGINSQNDLYGDYWTRRNLDLSYILFDWQYRMFVDAAYFYRPLYWNAGHWHFGIYARYPHRDYFYFGCPHFYNTYRGAHAWHHHHSHDSWYYGRDFGRRPGTDNHRHTGMRDGFNKGDYGRGGRVDGGNHDRGDFGSKRGSLSSTRLTVGSHTDRFDKAGKLEQGVVSGASKGNTTTTDRPSTFGSGRNNGNISTGTSVRQGTFNGSTNVRRIEGGAVNQRVGNGFGTTVNRSNGTAVNRSTGITTNRSNGTTVNRSTGSSFGRSGGSSFNRSSGTTVNRSSGTTMNRSTGSGSVSRSGGQSNGGGSFGGGRR